MIAGHFDAYSLTEIGTYKPSSVLMQFSNRCNNSIIMGTKYEGKVTNQAHQAAAIICSNKLRLLWGLPKSERELEIR